MLDQNEVTVSGKITRGPTITTADEQTYVVLQVLTHDGYGVGVKRQYHNVAVYNRTVMRSVMAYGCTGRIANVKGRLDYTDNRVTIIGNSVRVYTTPERLLDIGEELTDQEVVDGEDEEVENHGG